MTEHAPRPPGLHRSLSFKLLLLTIFFVMLSELFIYAPSVARYRKAYLEDRLADAHLATLALQATPDNMVSDALRTELLDHARAYGVVSREGDTRKLMLMRDMPPAVDLMVDLREGSFMGFIVDAYDTLVQSENRILRVVGMSPKDPSVMIEILLDEAPMRMEMYDYSQRILGLSLIISFFTASLVYLSLHLLLVRPMMRMSENMTAFSEGPENAANMIQPGGRTDEIGLAQRQLRHMQEGLRGALRQKEHLAALGTAVTKINHDLRNILSSAQLVADRIAHTADPEVRRVAPTLVRAIDRAVRLCKATLDYARSEAAGLAWDDVPVRALVDDLGGELPRGDGEPPAEIDNAVDADLVVRADRDQLFRVLANLAANAAQAGARTVRISAARDGDRARIDVADDGPGLPPRARENLFRAFEGSARTGGSGLGLAIAREVMRAHGGAIDLVETGADGTTFRLTLPAGRASRAAA